MYFVDDNGNYNWHWAEVAAAHDWCGVKVQYEVMCGRDVVVSNTFTREKELKPYVDLAASYGYHVTSIIVENRHGNKSVHGVPEHTMEAMKNRFSVKL